jgi:hypothetical protein
VTKAKKKDYFKLPFEVFYSDITYTSFDLLYDPDHPPAWMEDYPAIRINQGRSYGALFACDENKNGELIAVAYGGALDEYVPHWLTFIADDDLDIKSAETRAFSVKEGVLEFGKEVASEGLEEEQEISFSSYFGDDGSVPKYLVLDSKGARLKVDIKGYPLDDAGQRTGQPTVFDLSDEEAENCSAPSLDWYDLRVELASFFE